MSFWSCFWHSYFVLCWQNSSSASLALVKASLSFPPPPVVTKQGFSVSSHFTFIMAKPYKTIKLELAEKQCFQCIANLGFKIHIYIYIKFDLDPNRTETFFSYFERRAISRKPEAPQTLLSLPVKRTSKLVSLSGQLQAPSIPGPGANPPGASAPRTGTCAHSVSPVLEEICQEYRWVSSSSLLSGIGKSTVLSTVPAK